MTPESYKRLYAEKEDLEAAYGKLLKAAGNFLRVCNEFPDDPSAWGESFDVLWTVVSYCEAEENGFSGIRRDLAEIMAR